jgi:hypothetical protein
MSIAICTMRVIVVEVAEFLSGSPVAHESGTITAHGSSEGEDVRVTLRVDRACPDIRRGL